MIGDENTCVIHDLEKRLKEYVVYEGSYKKYIGEYISDDKEYFTPVKQPDLIFQTVGVVKRFPSLTNAHVLIWHKHSYSLMTTVICRITMNLRTTAYTSYHHQSSHRHPTQTGESDGDIALARFYQAMVGDIRQGTQRSAQASFQSKTDEDHDGGVTSKPFANGNGYGEYAYHHERVFKDV